MRLIHLLGALFCATLLAGCGKGLDRSADFSTYDSYQTAVNQAFKEMTPAEGEAFNWAVSDQTIDSIAQKYKGMSFRQIALNETDGAIKQYQEKLVNLKKAKAQFDPIMAGLHNVTVETSNASVKKDTGFGGFGEPKFAFKMKVKNGSQFDFSLLTWKTSLYINGDSKPVATAEIYDSYESDGGLKAGQQATREVEPDTFFSKDWITLAVQNAKQIRVEAVLEDAKDFSNKSLLEGAPYASIDKIQQTLDLAERYRTSLTN